MAVRSKSTKAAAPKVSAKKPGKALKSGQTRPIEMKAKAPQKKSTGKAVKSAPSKVIAAKPASKGSGSKASGKTFSKTASKTSPKAAAPKANAKVMKGAVNETPVSAKSGRAGRAGKSSSSKAAHSAAAAVERVTERLMGRVSAESAFESVCREVACEGLGTSAGYCRLHYIKNWKKIKRKEVILKEGKLNQYIEELVGKYPEKYIEAIRLDLANDKEFAKVIVDLDLDENDDDFESEGSGDSDVGIDSLKREFDEDADAF